MIYRYAFLLLLLVTPSLSFCNSSSSSSSSPPTSYSSHLLALVADCIQHHPSYKNPQELKAMLKTLDKRGCVRQTGSDDLRVSFVTLQGCIEHVLACSQAIHETVDLVGMIHTPTPATPLCTRPESVDKALFDESIRYNRDKLLTVQSRAQILREYLMKEGELFVIYPQGGLEKRTPEQQQVYFEELQRYKSRLHNWVLKTSELQSDMIGATYFFRDAKEKKLYVFSIKATQVNDPKQKFEWGIWFGSADQPMIKHRIDRIFSYLRSVEGPRKELFIDSAQ